MGASLAGMRQFKKEKTSMGETRVQSITLHVKILFGTAT